MTLFDPSDAGPGVGSDVDDIPDGQGTDDRRVSGGDGPDGSHDDRVRLRLVVAYDGRSFRGFAAQPGQRTVAGELGRALATVLRQPVALTCAGRTDAGVHAVGQVVHLDVSGTVDCVGVTRAVNTMLGPAIAVRSAAVVSDGFDARRSARARRYRYLVLQSEGPDPLLAPLSWHVRDRLDVRAMAAGADALLGEHDFRAFCRRPPGTPRGEPIRRRVLDASWHELPWAVGGLDASARLLGFDIEAQSFCHQMVRSIVGTLVDVGRGRGRASDVTWLLGSGDRSQGTTLAPAHGLTLQSVAYGEMDP